MPKRGTTLELGRFAAKFAGSVVEHLPEDIDPEIVLYWINHGEHLARRLEALKTIEVSPAAAVSVPTSPFNYDKREQGWRLLEDVVPTISEVSKLELIPFLGEGESVIGGEEMVHRACMELRANLGQRDAEWLCEHQQKIPAKWREYRLVFAGTVWQNPSGDRNVASLYYGGGRLWYMGWDYLSGVCGYGCRLVRSGESAVCP